MEKLPRFPEFGSTPGNRCWVQEVGQQEALL